MRAEREPGGLRASALWGRGGRVIALTALALVALAIPIAASARNGPSSGRSVDGTYVDDSLLRRAERNPDATLHVIVQSDAGIAVAAAASADVGSVEKRLPLVEGVAADLTGAQLQHLQQTPGLTVTPNAPMRLDAKFSSSQLWPHAHDFTRLWDKNNQNSQQQASSSPAIAIVDSGVESSRPDFSGRVVASANLTTLPNNSPRDGYGHGTLVAGIAAGSARNYAGGAPTADIVSLDVMDDNGMARTSDVIRAAQWILVNKDRYDIRVANFSLHSATPSNFTFDPLDKAVEKLWFAGVVVVASSGNYAVNGQPSGVLSAPGNDPFVITVGATDLNQTLSSADDTVAPWSSFGYTYDGFWKPEISASGRYMTGPVPTSSTLYSQRADSIVAPGYLQLSGTSLSAPVVSGAAALILALHPAFGPDEVKGALMATARPLALDTQYAGGVGEVDAAKAANVHRAPNPNAALETFLVHDPSGGTLPVFDAAAWYSTAQANVAWDDVAWEDIAWQDSAAAADGTSPGYTVDPATLDSSDDGADP